MYITPITKSFARFVSKHLVQVEEALQISESADSLRTNPQLHGIGETPMQASIDTSPRRDILSS